MDRDRPDAKLLDSIKKSRVIINTFPQGSNLEFEKLMNPDFTKKTAMLKGKLFSIIQKLAPNVNISGGITSENTLSSLAQVADSLIQESVCVFFHFLGLFYLTLFIVSIN